MICLPKYAIRFCRMAGQKNPKQQLYSLKRNPLDKRKGGYSRKHRHFITNGKIAAIGKDLPESKAQRIIDATGKYVTSGIIDEHSHIAISKGVNGNTSRSAEVRIGDVVNCKILIFIANWLAALLLRNYYTARQNPIGGQSGTYQTSLGI